uniref:Uncharacterized protein n=1 Tax=Timema douglasi TaxID=61478 RepID=A0A7R8VJP3_TIMDO|nr:unnamed protein product [Timema douglasi]
MKGVLRRGLEILESVGTRVRCRVIRCHCCYLCIVHISIATGTSSVTCDDFSLATRTLSEFDLLINGACTGGHVVLVTVLAIDWSIGNGEVKVLISPGCIKNGFPCDQYGFPIHSSQNGGLPFPELIVLYKQACPNVTCALRLSRRFVQGPLHSHASCFITLTPVEPVPSARISAELRKEVVPGGGRSSHGVLLTPEEAVMALFLQPASGRNESSGVKHDQLPGMRDLPNSLNIRVGGGEGRGYNITWGFNCDVNALNLFGTTQHPRDCRRDVKCLVEVIAHRHSTVYVRCQNSSNMVAVKVLFRAPRQRQMHEGGVSRSQQHHRSN